MLKFGLTTALAAMGTAMYAAKTKGMLPSALQNRSRGIVNPPTSKGNSGLHQRRTSGYIVNTDDGSILQFQYNPAEWADEQGNNFGAVEAPGMEYPLLFWTGGETSVIQLSLDFHEGASPTGGGTDAPSAIMSKVKKMAAPRMQQKEMIRGANHFISPPVCLFVWGNEQFKFVLQKYRFQRKFFNTNLNTVMLNVNLEMLLVK